MVFVLDMCQKKRGTLETFFLIFYSLTTEISRSNLKGFWEIHQSSCYFQIEKFSMIIFLDCIINSAFSVSQCLVLK